MKKLFSVLLTIILICLYGGGLAATYTLPEKMHNQLAIGSGLKGTFTVTTDGEAFKTPFLNAITGAELSLRGISSGKNFHYYVFQNDAQEQPSALSELFRNEGVYYFRSDMVPGKVLSFPTGAQILESMFPAKGENPSVASVIMGLISLTETEKTEKWAPVLTRYQNELEMWLADFTVQAETVKLESGFSALDFTYHIPVGDVYQEILKLFGEFAADTEMVSMLDTVITEEEKKVYLNPQLLYYYEEALNSLDLNQPVVMNKRVSAMGEVLRSKLELPLDARTTGWKYFSMETRELETIYTLKNEEQIIILGVPVQDQTNQPAFERSYRLACIIPDPLNPQNMLNLSAVAEVVKTNTSYNDEEERTHETDHYSIKVRKDETLLPPEYTVENLLPTDEIGIELDLHYYSKYAQNSATTLEISADVTQGDSNITFRGKLKTAAPWLFMPFEVIDPISVGTKPEEVLIPYITDWISNASSMYHYSN